MSIMPPVLRCRARKTILFVFSVWDWTSGPLHPMIGCSFKRTRVSRHLLEENTTSLLCLSHLRHPAGPSVGPQQFSIFFTLQIILSFLFCQLVTPCHAGTIMTVRACVFSNWYELHTLLS